MSDRGRLYITREAAQPRRRLTGVIGWALVAAVYVSLLALVVYIALTRR